MPIHYTKKIGKHHLEVHYSYDYEDGVWDDGNGGYPPSESIEVTSVLYNNEELFDLVYEIAPTFMLELEEEICCIERTSKHH